MDEKIEEIIRKAEEGDTEAMVALGIIYGYGNYGVERDYDKSAHWFREAANAGDVNGMLMFGFACLSGQGVEEEPKKAVYWFRRAAVDKEDARGMRLLGVAYKDGEGIRKNLHHSVSWLEKAVHKGDIPAMYDLYHAITLRRGVNKDTKKASEMLQKAMDAGDTRAMLVLGHAHKNGGLEEYGVEKNLELSLRCYQAAVKKDKSAGTMLLLGLAFIKLSDSQSGKIDKNIKEGLGWIRKAASEGVIAPGILAGIWEREGFPFNNKFSNLLEIIIYIYLRINKTINEKHLMKDRVIHHYTHIKTLQGMFSGDNKNFFRLYSPMYFNDPEEGKMFTNSETVLDDFYNKEYDSEDVLPHVIWFDGKEVASFYICSFSSKPDDLDLWRAYGKNGKGYCVSVNIPDELRKQKNISHGIDESSNIFLGSAYKNSHKSRSKPGKFKNMVIRRVVYGTKEMDKSIGFNRKTGTYTNGSLGDMLTKLKKLTAPYRSVFQDEVDGIVKFLLEDLHYLYKDEAYKSENEYRIIGVKHPRGLPLRIDDDKDPPRFYINTPTFVFERQGNKIIIGPDVFPKSAAKAYLLHKLGKYGWGKTTEVQFSKIPYRGPLP